MKLEDKSREIKFRAWDDINKRITYDFFFIDSDGGIWHDQDPYGLDMSGQKKIVSVNRLHLMQHTGLKDKNKLAIYEGDLVKFFYWSTYEQRSFPEYVDFRETEMKEAIGSVYWNESELSWYVTPIDATVYNGNEKLVKLEDIPLVYCGLTMEAISEWVSEYEASEEDLNLYTGRDGVIVVGHVYQPPNY